MLQVIARVERRLDRLDACEEDVEAVAAQLRLREARLFPQAAVRLSAVRREEPRRRLAAGDICIRESDGVYVPGVPSPRIFMPKPNKRSMIARFAVLLRTSDPWDRETDRFLRRYRGLAPEIETALAARARGRARMRRERRQSACFAVEPAGGLHNIASDVTSVDLVFGDNSEVPSNGALNVLRRRRDASIDAQAECARGARLRCASASKDAALFAPEGMAMSSPSKAIRPVDVAQGGDTTAVDRRLRPTDPPAAAYGRLASKKQSNAVHLVRGKV